MKQSIDVQVVDAFNEAVALENASRFDDAFRAYQAANRLKRPQVNAEGAAKEHAAVLDALPYLFSPELFEKYQGSGRPRPLPIFIVGLPRSGSTLVEQIICSHPNVQGLGEINVLAKIAWRQYPFPGAPPLPNHFQHLADQYLEGVYNLGWNRRRRFTDKQLSNYRLVGLIHLLFPNAVILHTVRNALDTCVSCYRHPFDKGDQTRFTYDLKDIGEHYIQYRNIMDFWNDCLPGRVIDINYERLVENFESEVANLLDRCKLSYHPDCLRFFENQRGVRTSSWWQVKRPISNNSIGRWRDYERHLGPLVSALGKYADAAMGQHNR